MSRAILLYSLLLACAPAIGAQDKLLDVNMEWMSSGSVQMGSSWIRYKTPINHTTSVAIRLEGMSNRIEYTPFEETDLFGSRRTIRETLIGAQIQFKHRVNRFEWGLLLHAYDGFRNFSSIWLDEYYRQQYAGGGIPGVQYEDPSPSGYGLDGSWRIEVVPSSGFLTITAGLLRDQVAPGYEIDDMGTSFALIRSETDLDTVSTSLGWEALLNRRVRTRQTVRLTDTTDRQLRVTLSSDLNWLIADRWISRSGITFASEDPRFEAWSVSETIEYQLASHWTVNGTFRYYSDTGQIESANLVSSAAPALFSRQAMLSLRYESETGATELSISTGPYQTRYDEPGIGTERFRHLYTDRDWWWSGFSYRHAF